MNHCKTCKNAIFDPLWGDFKCEIHKVIIHPDQKLDCEHYKEGTPKKSKGDTSWKR